jgi:hypothetical protein
MRGKGEIGDIPVLNAELEGDFALRSVWGRRGGFAFQTEWSNRDGKAELDRRDVARTRGDSDPPRATNGERARANLL